LSVFSRKILVKWWPWEVATLGTLPEAKWPKVKFLRDFTIKNLDIGSGHFGDRTLPLLIELLTEQEVSERLGINFKTSPGLKSKMTTSRGKISLKSLT
jgi:hypothetical protein